MGGKIWLALAILIAAVPAYGQSDEDYSKYARPVIDEFTACAYPKVEEMAKTNHGIYEVLQNQRPPFKYDNPRFR